METQMNKTVILYLIGKAGIGKYTISQEIAKSGFTICDNQLINNPIFTLLNYDGLSRVPSFAWDAIETIRHAVHKFLSQKHDGNYVLTNCLAETHYDHKLYNRVKRIAQKRGSLFVPIKLSITQAEHLKRIVEPSRRLRWKSVNPEETENKGPLIIIKHPHLLELDISALSAKEAAIKILAHVQKNLKV